MRCAGSASAMSTERRERSRATPVRSRGGGWGRPSSETTTGGGPTQEAPARFIERSNGANQKPKGPSATPPTAITGLALHVVLAGEQIPPGPLMQVSPVLQPEAGAFRMRN